MGDAPAAKEGKKSGWFRTLGGACGGLLSGALMMYASPLIDKYVKPAKPVANFRFETQGTTVTFHNISIGATEGWWDFGDGTALEPASPQQTTLSHVYPNAGDYTVKLSVRNLLGDQDDRATPLHLSETKVETPTIDSFTVEPIDPYHYAPATFRVKGKVKGAQLCFLDAGDERTPIILNEDAQMNQEHFITLDKPGGYVVQLVAVNGPQYTLKSDIAQVNVTPRNLITAALTVEGRAVRVENRQTTYNFAQTFSAQERDDRSPVNLTMPAPSNWAIQSVRLASNSQPTLACPKVLEAAISATPECRGAHNLRLQLSSDQRSLHLTGDLVKDASLLKWKTPLPSLLLPVTVTQERRTPSTCAPVTLMAHLGAPSSVILPIPPARSDFVEVNRTYQIDLQYNGQSVWHGSHLPTGQGVLLTIGKRQLLFSTTLTGDQIRLDLRDAPAGNHAN